MPRKAACFLVRVCYFDPVGAWLSLVERTVRDREVGGSNPLAPTTSFVKLFHFSLYYQRAVPFTIGIVHPLNAP